MYATLRTPSLRPTGEVLPTSLGVTVSASQARCESQGELAKWITCDVQTQTQQGAEAGSKMVERARFVVGLISDSR